MRGTVQVPTAEGATLWVSKTQKQVIRDLIHSHKLVTESEIIQHLLDEHERNNGHESELKEGAHA